MPVSRKCALISGLHRRILSYVPPPYVRNYVPNPLKQFGYRSLYSALGNFPPTPRAALTKAQRLKVEEAERTILEQVADGNLVRVDLVIASLSRSKAAIKPKLSVNKVPESADPYLFVISVGEVIDQVPDHKRKFFRLLKQTEMLALHGFDPAVATYLATPLLAQKAARTFCPPPLYMAVMHPMLSAIGISGLDLRAWPEPLMGLSLEAAAAASSKYDRVWQAALPPLEQKEQPKQKNRAKRIRSFADT